MRTKHHNKKRHKQIIRNLILGGVFCCRTGVIINGRHGRHHRPHVHYDVAPAENGGETTCPQGSPCASPQPMNFGEGWRASDNAIGMQVSEFPTGQLGKRIRAINGIHRYVRQQICSRRIYYNQLIS
jgi:hypothetical protein